jgi:hypothetical protein
MKTAKQLPSIGMRALIGSGFIRTAFAVGGLSGSAPFFHRAGRTELCPSI